ncbi:hypothetical protein EV11_1198 [Prochlorococcus sp. SS52]|nr:hypothetical protein EV04_0529 [Prochlorococcus marinus str. LG]KGG19176.1 hypothetical protein EV08_1663 [Prochlorococcus marinus str. SS2]KGG23283.1 hypothetical protein EV09_0907 [Prochlorococcus marinus str. SS35]KGG32482.1 hypothetical protein EV10_1597 [Prochlorococcus marinus str. SS51]KGG35634.1 hypothetical protein EV11_1198 [Prochlorococcus sp. SS52]
MSSCSASKERLPMKIVIQKKDLGRQKNEWSSRKFFIAKAHKLKPI